MTIMRAIEAAVLVMRREGITTAFGIPGAAINPLYAALKTLGGIDHVLARHVEGASHMAEGYTRAVAGNIGVCIGTSGPAGTDMITGLYSASADSIPILCITGQAPRARLHKEDFQAVDIASIAAPVSKWATGDGTRPGALCVPEGLPTDAQRSARPSADRSAVRCANGGNRIRHRRLRTSAHRQATGQPQAGGKSVGHAQQGRTPADRCRGRHH